MDFKKKKTSILVPRVPLGSHKLLQHISSFSLCKISSEFLVKAWSKEGKCRQRKVREEEEDSRFELYKSILFKCLNDNDFDFKLGGNESNQPKKGLG